MTIQAMDEDDIDFRIWMSVHLCHPKVDNVVEVNFGALGQHVSSVPYLHFACFIFGIYHIWELSSCVGSKSHHILQ